MPLGKSSIHNEILFITAIQRRVTISRRNTKLQQKFSYFMYPFNCKINSMDFPYKQHIYFMNITQLFKYFPQYKKMSRIVAIHWSLEDLIFFTHFFIWLTVTLFIGLLIFLVIVVMIYSVWMIKMGLVKKVKNIWFHPWNYYFLYYMYKK